MCIYVLLNKQYKFGGDDRDRTCCDRSRKIYSLLPYHYGGISKIRIKLLVSTPALKLSGYSVHLIYSKSVCSEILPIRACEGIFNPHANGFLPPDLYR